MVVVDNCGGGGGGGNDNGDQNNQKLHPYNPFLIDENYDS